MVAEPKTIDISEFPELVRLAEEVRDTNEPRVLQHEGEDVAVLMPVRPKRRRLPKKSEEDLAAFRSAAGGWSDVDTDTLIENIYADRRRGDRPPVEL